MTLESRPNVQTALDGLPIVPLGWTFLCDKRELDRKVVLRETLLGRLVAFRTASNKVGVLDARCQHLGANLGNGRVVGEELECPFHHWRYGVNGNCDAVPVCQSSYPVTVQFGMVFVWSGPEALYPLPFFDDLDVADYTCSGPLVFDLECPWYLVGANSFDTQHLYAVHERVLLEPPKIESHGHYALRSRTVSQVVGGGWYDRFIRTVSGPVGTMTATNWSGCYILVQVEFARTNTFGIVSLRPTRGGRTLVHVFAVIKRSRSKLAREFCDGLRTTLRRYFIAQFVKDDSQKLDGIRSGPFELAHVDKDLASYFRWLARTSNGMPAAFGSWTLANTNLLGRTHK